MLGRFLSITVQLKLVPAVYVAGFLVSNVAFFGAVYYLSRLSGMILNNGRLAFVSATFLAFYPAGVFFSAVYSDSLFLLLTISALYYCWRDNPGRSAALGFLASLTRPVGILLVVPVTYKLLQDPSRRKAARAYLPVVGIMLGCLIFAAYSQLMTGTMFASWMAERSYWPVYFNPYDRFMGDLRAILVKPIILPYLVLSLSALVAYIQRVRNRDETAIGLYAICLLAAYLISPLDSFARYSITLLPTYWIFSSWSEDSAVKVLICALFLILLGIGTALFVNWYRFY
jgi:xanthosine utilization system XapX-like protein